MLRNATPTAGSAEMIAGRVQVARDRAGLSQQTVAETMGWKAQTVSDLERGVRQLKASELAQLSALLGVPYGALLGLEEIPGEPFVLWRTTGNRPHRADESRKRREAQLRDRAQRYALLVEWTNEAPTHELPDFPVDVRTMTRGEAETLANQCLRTLRLGSTPARNLAETLEAEFGVRIFYEDLSLDGDGSAACTRESAFGSAILVSSAEPPWRRAFSIAHELFHLVTWEATRKTWRDSLDASASSWYSDLERRANDFAGALLLPAESLRESFQKRTDSTAGVLAPHDAAQLAIHFGVSRDALAIRLHSLRLIDESTKQLLRTDHEFDSAWRALTVVLTHPPASTFSERYRQLVQVAYRRGEIGRAKAATLLEIALPELARSGFDAAAHDVGDDEVDAALR